MSEEKREGGGSCEGRGGHDGTGRRDRRRGKHDAMSTGEGGGAAESYMRMQIAIESSWRHGWYARDGVVSSYYAPS